MILPQALEPALKILRSQTSSSVFGIGVDILDQRRLKKVCNNHLQRFIQRILTPQEQNELSLLVDSFEVQRFLCKAWAAKEAVSKALGTGIGEHCSFQDIALKMPQGQPPSFILSDKVEKRLISHNSESIQSVDSIASHYYLSFSDETPWIVAFALIECQQQQTNKADLF